MRAVLKWLAIGLVPLGLGLGLGNWLGRGDFADQSRQGFARLAAWQPPKSAGPRSPRRLELAPPLVRAYLRRAIPAGAPRARVVSLRQTGWFRPSPAWPRLELEARQDWRVDAPGLVWSAKLRLLPLFWLGMIDSYIGTGAYLRGKALGLVSVLGQEGRPAKQRLLLRYLAEAPLFPSALVPGPHLVWEALGRGAARAVLTHQGLRASGVFYFNRQGDPSLFVTRQRTRDLGQGRRVRQGWTLTYSHYQDFAGWRLPTRVSAAWRPPEGPFVYAEFSVSQLTRR